MTRRPWLISIVVRPYKLCPLIGHDRVPLRSFDLAGDGLPTLEFYWARDESELAYRMAACQWS